MEAHAVLGQARGGAADGRRRLRAGVAAGCVVEEHEPLAPGGEHGVEGGGVLHLREHAALALLAQQPRRGLQLRRGLGRRARVRGRLSRQPRGARRPCAARSGREAPCRAGGRVAPRAARDHAAGATHRTSWCTRTRAPDAACGPRGWRAARATAVRGRCHAEAGACVSVCASVRASTRAAATAPAAAHLRGQLHKRGVQQRGVVRGCASSGGSFRTRASRQRSACQRAQRRPSPLARRSRPHGWRSAQEGGASSGGHSVPATRRRR